MCIGEGGEEGTTGDSGGAPGEQGPFISDIITEPPWGDMTHLNLSSINEVTDSTWQTSGSVPTQVLLFHRHPVH